MTSLFLAGLFGGATHCAFMCAPFVVMLQQKTLGRVSSVLLLPYHFGRMTTYIVLGVLANLFLSVAFPVSSVRYVVASLFLGLAGLMFLVQSLPFLGQFFPFLLKIHLPLPLAPIQRGVTRLLHKQSLFHLYVVGIMLGFIPCGLVMGALLAVATLDESIKAALGMAAFCVGTIPSLIMVAIGGKTLATIFPTHFRLLSQWVVVLNGMLLIIIAGILLP
ncbi:MAG: sulfite exporter TauE/SafE family protein [Alphaproteobacteria bacterium]|nr:sulfite exporter TauE/SafE family protein [Alphaproteobacteria bacterium]MCB1551306.1 sulfite exporter TauE/SafE family protein [Alphaproteobacteria bacterium]MCB9985404.1 sulfite exporter TauE/SafE family protein [Micavibrio sp.]HRK98181.1 sulfite exporter TauE/SafE family protein [Alphaproteobacteria bacterium]